MVNHWLNKRKWRRGCEWFLLRNGIMSFKEIQRKSIYFLDSICRAWKAKERNEKKSNNQRNN